MSFQFAKQDHWRQEDYPQCAQAKCRQQSELGLAEPGLAESGLVLTQVSHGCRCRIRRHRAHGAIRQRLLDLGLVPNAEVEMVRCATLGDPLEMRVGDYYVTLRKREADLIEVCAA
jgi:ferrous iron transport protein A